MSISSNLQEINERIASAAQRSGRSAADITLAGITKYVDPTVARKLYEAGCTQLGESRPQVLWEKAQALADCDITWHMVGHLQRNKAKKTVEYADLIHSVDSLKLLETISHLAQASGKIVEVLLEINVSAESAKHGIDPQNLGAFIDWFAEGKSVRLRGLMCMAGLEGETDHARREFASLRELRDQYQLQLAEGQSLDDLSMGMSGDFEIAIEEGATIIRVGTALYRGIE